MFNGSSLSITHNNNIKLTMLPKIILELIYVSIAISLVHVCTVKITQYRRLKIRPLQFHPERCICERLRSQGCAPLDILSPTQIYCRQ